MQPPGMPGGYPAPPGWNVSAVPRPEGTWRSPGYREAGTRALFAVFSLGVTALVAVGTAVVAGVLVAQLIDYRQGAANGEDISQMLDVLDGAYALAALLMLPTAFAFLAWLSRAIENAPPLGAGTPETSPAASIGWWFVPLANLVMPYRIVRDLVDRLAVPWLQPGRVGVLSWWLMFVFGYLLRGVATAATRLQADTREELVNQFLAAGALAALGCIALTSSAIEAIRIVREVQKRADFRAAYLMRPQGSWPAGAQVPGPYGMPGTASPPPMGPAASALAAPGPAQGGAWSGWPPPGTPPVAPPPVPPPSVAGAPVAIAGIAAAGVAAASTAPALVVSFCPRCGLRRVTPDRYCAACGYDLAAIGGAPTAMVTAQPAPPVQASLVPAGPIGATAQGPDQAGSVSAPPPPVEPVQVEPPVSQPAVPAPPVVPSPDLSPDGLVDWSGERIYELDALLDRLYEQGSAGGAEDQAANDELTEIGRRLYAAGGEELMRRALVRAQEHGMRGRYVERHWTGIGSWMG